MREGLLENMSLHSDINSITRTIQTVFCSTYLNLFLPYRVSMVVAERHESGSAMNDFLLTGSKEQGRR